MKIVAGIDGGGTSTTLLMESLETGEKKKIKFGPFNINGIGEKAFREQVDKIFEEINAFGECQMLVIGAAGLSNGNVEEILKSKAKRLGFARKMLVKNDGDIALYGAMSGGPGAMLISGTGSICIGRTAKDKNIRVGGWGNLIDDPGSGYAIGRDVLEAYVQAYDGRGKKTLLTELVNKEWDIKDPYELISKIYPTRDKSVIASLSPLCDAAARKGDKVAEKILRDEAKALADLVIIMFKRLRAPYQELSLMGGLLENDTLLRKYLIEILQKKLPMLGLKPPAMSAAEGALLWAKKLLEK